MVVVKPTCHCCCVPILVGDLAFVEQDIVIYQTHSVVLQCVYGVQWCHMNLTVYYSVASEVNLAQVAP